MHHGLLRLAAAIAVGAALRWGVSEPLRSRRLGTAGFEDHVVLASAAIAGVVVVWVAAVSALTVAAAAPGVVGRAAWAAMRWLTPRALRGAAQVALGVSVVTAPVAGAGSAHAATELPDIGHPAVAHGAGTPPVVPVPAAPPTLTATPVVVQPGDTLWAIAARQLGPTATRAEIAAQWPRWYAANRTAIGTDPDLIYPGLALHPPAPEGDS